MEKIKMTNISKYNDNGIEKHYGRDIYSINFEIRQIYQIKCEKMRKKSILKVFRAALRLIEIIAADCNSTLRIRKPHIYSNLGCLIQNLSKVGKNFNITHINDWNENIVLIALEQGLKNVSIEENPAPISRNAIIILGLMSKALRLSFVFLGLECILKFHSHSPQSIDIW